MSDLAALAAQIAAIDPVDDRERRSLAGTLERLTWGQDPFDETLHVHHLTASAFVVSSRGVILHRHRRLGIWVQPGGHVDAHETPDDAAVRETLEETGLEAAHTVPPPSFTSTFTRVRVGTRTTTCVTCSSRAPSIRRPRRARVPRSTGSISIGRSTVASRRWSRH